MTYAIVALAIAVALLVAAVGVLLKVVLSRPDRHVVLGVLSTEDTIAELRSAVDDLTDALAGGKRNVADAADARDRIDQSTRELEP